MQIPPFKLERYFARYEFAAQYLMSSSDAEPLTQRELLDMAAPDDLALWEQLSLGYTESKGHPLLLERISALYTEAITPAQVIEAVPEEGIFIAMNSLLTSGDHVIVTSPAYQSLYQIAQSIGCSVSYWTPNPADWTFNTDDLVALVQPNTKLIVMNFPHNPTGALLTREQFDTVIHLARENDAYLFSDEMYRWSEHDAAHRLPSACEVYDKAVTLCGMSKTFALPGLRTGWLATQDADLMHRFTVMKDYTTICGSAPSQILSIIGLGVADTLIERTLNIVGDNLTLLDAFFASQDERLSWQRPQAGTIGLLTWHGATSADDLADALVRERGVMLLPGSQFDLTENVFRVGFGRRNLPDVLEALDGFFGMQP
jgi:aspartate/methionine/tyrosine aminotransferase